MAQVRAGATRDQALGRALLLRLGARFDEALRAFRQVGTCRRAARGPTGEPARDGQHLDPVAVAGSLDAGARGSRAAHAAGVAELGKVLVERLLGAPLVPVSQAGVEPPPTRRCGEG